MLAVIALATIAVMVFVLRAATATDWVTLSTNIRPDKVAEAQSALESEGIESRVLNGGAVLQVPSGRLDEASVVVATQGVDVGKLSMKACDLPEGSAIAAQTTTQQKTRQLECLQSRLAAGIQGIDGVKTASVILNSPDRPAFSDEKSPGSASVTINTGGAELERKQVRAITEFVANSVDNVARDKVSIVDETGRLLTDGSDGGAGSITEAEAKLRVETAFAQQKEIELTRKFEQIVGDGKVLVSMNPEIDMDKISRETEDYGGKDDVKGPAAREDLDTEVLKGAGSTTGGTTGVAGNVAIDSNDPRYAGETAAQEADTNYARPRSTVVYNNDRLAEAISVAQGAVKRYRLSVVVSSKVAEEPRTAVETAANQWVGEEEAVAFSVAKLPKPAGVSKEQAASERKSALFMYLKWGLLGAGLVGMAFYLRRALNDRTYELLYPDEDAMAALEQPAFNPVPLKELEAAVSAAVSSEHQQRIELQSRIEGIAQSKPNDVAQHLRGWLHEDARRQ